MSWKNERIYIAVKTYPTISERYAELVCTAGVREDGSWIRLYPVPFRLLSDDQKYSKYTWINAYVEKNKSDFRLESYRPDLSTIDVEPKPKIVDWEERREILFKNKEVFTNKEKLVAAAKRKENPISLALFKPAERPRASTIYPQTHSLLLACSIRQSSGNYPYSVRAQALSRSLTLFSILSLPCALF